MKGKQTVLITLADDGGEEPIPARYNKNSELTVEVVEGGAPYDFDLTSEPDQERDVAPAKPGGKMGGKGPGGFGGRPKGKDNSPQKPARPEPDDSTTDDAGTE